jgi:hypothetical protein
VGGGKAGFLRDVMEAAAAGVMVQTAQLGLVELRPAGRSGLSVVAVTGVFRAEMGVRADVEVQTTIPVHVPKGRALPPMREADSSGAGHVRKAPATVISK